MANKPMMSLRVPLELRRAATEKAAAEGRTLTDVLVKALERYVKTPPKTSAK